MDITARNFINQRPNLVKWLKRMENPKIEGDFVGWSDVHLTIEPILEKEIAELEKKDLLQKLELAGVPAASINNVNY